MIFRNKQILNNKGATLVEFALSSGLLFMFLILGLDVLRLAYHTSTLQYALGKGAAAGVIKASAARVINADDKVVMEPAATRIKIIKDEIKNLGNNFGLGIEEDNLEICTTIEDTCQGKPQFPGNTKDFVRVDFHRGFPFIWGALVIPINIYVIVKNEPF